MIVNLFAYRATDPRVMRRADDPVGPGNDAAILRWVTHARAAVVVCGWGAAVAVGRRPLIRERPAAVRRLLYRAGVRPQCLGVTADGHPRHPLYLPAAAELEPFGG